MEDKKGGIKKKTGRYNIVVSVIVSFITGAILCSLIIFSVIPSLMIVTKESSFGFDETVAALDKSIVENGWFVSTVMDMNKSMAKHGVEFTPRVKLIKLCKPDYAKSVLASDRYISVMMPCTFSVWQGDDGKVYISKMNMGLMAKMFGGNVAKVMGGNVAEDEEKILTGILKD
jgi:uncharacterized protein (DUF302 family)